MNSKKFNWEKLIGYVILILFFILIISFIFVMIKGTIDTNKEKDAKENFLISKCQELGWSISYDQPLNTNRATSCYKLEEDFTFRYCPEKIGDKYYLRNC